ncbi:hypothetical protein ABZ725_31635 [Streptomyces sp. NPDC006872]|uniref:hypothetical protein n=1 Tax=Streptomyces sp. NPDC006872 TaxID=3155720 RepID=UPI0033CF7163
MGIDADRHANMGVAQKLLDHDKIDAFMLGSLAFGIIGCMHDAFDMPLGETK